MFVHVTNTHTSEFGHRSSLKYTNEWYSVFARTHSPAMVSFGIYYISTNEHIMKYVSDTDMPYQQQFGFMNAYKWWRLLSRHYKFDRSSRVQRKEKNTH